MIRNQPLLWVLSIGFELMEVCTFYISSDKFFTYLSRIKIPYVMLCELQLTFRHMLPNFNECWWDSIVLDILICNWFGEIFMLFSLFYLYIIPSLFEVWTEYLRLALVGMNILFVGFIALFCISILWFADDLHIQFVHRSIKLNQGNNMCINRLNTFAHCKVGGSFFPSIIYFSEVLVILEWGEEL